MLGKVHELHVSYTFFPHACNAYEMKKEKKGKVVENKVGKTLSEIIPM